MHGARCPAKLSSHSGSHLPSQCLGIHKQGGAVACGNAVDGRGSSEQDPPGGGGTLHHEAQVRPAAAAQTSAEQTSLAVIRAHELHAFATLRATSGHPTHSTHTLDMTQHDTTAHTHTRLAEPPAPQVERSGRPRRDVGGMCTRPSPPFAMNEPRPPVVAAAGNQAAGRGSRSHPRSSKVKRTAHQWSPPRREGSESPTGKAGKVQRAVQRDANKCASLSTLCAKLPLHNCRGRHACMGRQAVHARAGP